MSSSLTYTVVDQFDEDEFPDIPKAPAALLASLAQVPDPRKPRGLRHGLPVILSIAVCAVITGARSFVAIAEWAAAATPAAMAKLGVIGEVPSESTIRRTINKIDGNGLDVVVGAWAALRATTSEKFRVIAVDGKSLRGSATAGARCRHLLAALTHVGGLVLGQLNVDLKTNEIPMFSTLLDNIEILGALVTADALHCQKEHAKYLVEQRGAHYLLTVKGNQPTLRKQLAGLPWANVPITHTQHDRSHGRVEKRTLKVVTDHRRDPVPARRAGHPGHPQGPQTQHPQVAHRNRLRRHRPDRRPGPPRPTRDLAPRTLVHREPASLGSRRDIR